MRLIKSSFWLLGLTLGASLWARFPDDCRTAFPLKKESYWILVNGQLAYSYVHEEYTTPEGFVRVLDRMGDHTQLSVPPPSDGTPVMTQEELWERRIKPKVLRSLEKYRRRKWPQEFLDLLVTLSEENLYRSAYVEIVDEKQEKFYGGARLIVARYVEERGRLQGYHPTMMEEILGIVLAKKFYQQVDSEGKSTSVRSGENSEIGAHWVAKFPAHESAQHEIVHGLIWLDLLRFTFPKGLDAEQIFAHTPYTYGNEASEEINRPAGYLRGTDFWEFTGARQNQPKSEEIWAHGYKWIPLQSNTTKLMDFYAEFERGNQRSRGTDLRELRRSQPPNEAIYAQWVEDMGDLRNDHEKIQTRREMNAFLARAFRIYDFNQQFFTTMGQFGTDSVTDRDLVHRWAITAAKLRVLASGIVHDGLVHENYWRRLAALKLFRYAFQRGENMEAAGTIVDRIAEALVKGDAEMVGEAVGVLLDLQTHRWLHVATGRVLDNDLPGDPPEVVYPDGTVYRQLHLQIAHEKTLAQARLRARGIDENKSAKLYVSIMELGARPGRVKMILFMAMIRPVLKLNSQILSDLIFENVPHD